MPDSYISMQNQNFITKAEDTAENVYRKWKTVLPLVARLCLISGYVENSIRVLLFFTAYVQLVNHNWGCGWFLSYLYMGINLTLEITGATLVLLRKQTKYACCMLGVVVLQQFVTFLSSSAFGYLFRSLSFAGSLLLIYVESATDPGRSLFAGVPELEKNGMKSYLHLAGRVLVTILFALSVFGDGSLLHIIQSLFSITFMIFVCIGYKTKLSAFVIVIWLFFSNLYFNAFWMIADATSRYFVAYNFFQTISIIGGLLMIVNIGPGGVSLDARKKNW